MRFVVVVVARAYHIVHIVHRILRSVFSRFLFQYTRALQYSANAAHVRFSGSTFHPSLRYLNSFPKRPSTTNIRNVPNTGHTKRPPIGIICSRLLRPCIHHVPKKTCTVYGELLLGSSLWLSNDIPISVSFGRVDANSSARRGFRFEKSFGRFENSRNTSTTKPVGQIAVVIVAILFDRSMCTLVRFWSNVVDVYKSFTIFKARRYGTGKD